MRRALVLLVLLATACATPGSSSPSGPPTLDTMSGFQSKLSSTLDLKAAAAATPAQPAATSSALSQAGFSAGTERIFTRGDEFIEIVAFGFSTDVDAGQFVAFERSGLTSSKAAVLYADPAIPGSFVYDLSGGTRAGNRTVFCQGVWFAAHTSAYEVTDCAGSPRYPDLVESVALRQYQSASGGS